MLYGSEAWQDKVVNVISLERNDARMVKWMWNVRLGDRISAEEFRNKLKLNSMREF